MEEADVKQLISLIESAQLQYEVDESGTVSIVCDPVQVTILLSLILPIIIYLFLFFYT